MSEDNKIDVLGKFIEALAKEKSLDETRYIECCLNSIMGWQDTKYWERINLNSQDLLNKNINELCEKEECHIRSSSDISNKIYEKIYENDDIVGNDYHGYLLWAILKNISQKEAKRVLTDEDFMDYRISHVWGCTKNIYLNNLPFNYFAIPSFCYCLSDKNNGGKIGEDFRLKLKKQVINKCYESIVLYNKKMIKLANSILKNLNDYINDISNPKSKKIKNEKDYFSQRLRFILDQFILIPNKESNSDNLVDEGSWNRLIETGLNIFIYKNNVVEFSEEYKNAKKDNFKYFGS